MFIFNVIFGFIGLFNAKLSAFFPLSSIFANHVITYPKWAENRIVKTNRPFT